MCNPTPVAQSAIAQARRLSKSRLLDSKWDIKERYLLDLPEPRRLFGAVEINTNREARAAAELAREARLIERASKRLSKLARDHDLPEVKEAATELGDSLVRLRALQTLFTPLLPVPDGVRISGLHHINADTGMNSVSALVLVDESAPTLTHERLPSFRPFA